MSKVTNLLMDTSLMGVGAESRVFTVKGKPDSEFIVIIVEDGTLKYYNFETNLFELGHTSKNNLKVKISNSSLYRHTIDFPSGGGTYVVKLITEDGTFVRRNKKIISKNIEKQSSESTITFKPASIYKTGVSTDNYQTFPTVASTGSTNEGASLSSSFLVNNASTDAGGFGLKINTTNFGKWILDPKYGFEGVLSRGVFDSYWYVQYDKDIVVNTVGNGLDSKTVTAANSDGVSVGMELFYHKTTTTPVNVAGDDLENVLITSIQEGLGEVIITFNKAVAFENGETMRLRAYGSKNIHLNTGVAITVGGDCSITAPTLTKTVREDSDGDLTTSTTIRITDTHGISGGNTIAYTGFNVDNSSSNNVSVVTAPDCPDLTSSGALDNDGTITVQLTQILEKGTILTFKGVYNQFTMKFNIKIDKHPESNTDILFDLDKIITVGVSGS